MTHDPSKPSAFEKLVYVCEMPGYMPSCPWDDDDHYEPNDCNERSEFRLTYGDLRALREAFQTQSEALLRLSLKPSTTRDALP